MDMKKTKESNWMYVWLFVIGAFIGFILETLFYYFKNGIWINKQGLLYGPFKPIYGFGLILIVLVLKNYQDKKLWQKLLVGILIGSSFEYFGSLFQEYVFGTSTWNYSNFNYNISGRIYLPYCLAWGIIAVISIDILYPFIKKTLSKINEKVYYTLSIILTIFMIGNITLTALASIRYSDRANNKEANNIVFKTIDKLYPDEYMQIKFPKMKIITK